MTAPRRVPAARRAGASPRAPSRCTGRVGPARTTMSAVAEHAGVRRSTALPPLPRRGGAVRRLLGALGRGQPAPRPRARGRAIADPDERLRVALGELYAFYGRTAQMLENLLRDEQTSELVRERFARLPRLPRRRARRRCCAAAALRGARARDGSPRRLGHALAFSTWRSLVAEQGARCRASDRAGGRARDGARPAARRAAERRRRKPLAVRRAPYGSAMPPLITREEALASARSRITPRSKR